MSNITISPKTVMPFIEPRREEMIKLMGGEEVLMREMSFAIQAANNNQVLANSNPQSVAMAVYNCALTKLSLNPVMNLAYLVPFKGNAKLMPGYQGMIKLISDTGIIKAVSSAVVYRGDEFDFVQGTNPEIIHKPKGETFKDSDVIAVYAIFVLHNDEKLFEIMWKPQIDAIKNRSETGRRDVGPWSTDYAEMARKTVVKRGWKSIPKSSFALDKIEKVNTAISIDNEEYKTVEYVKMSEEQIERLLEKTTNVVELETALSDESVMIDPEQKKEIIEKARKKLKEATMSNLLNEILKEQAQASDQRSQAWFNARVGKFTASEIYKLMTQPQTKAARENGELSETTKTYIMGKVAEEMAGVEQTTNSAATDWGVDHEAEACNLYAEMMDSRVDSVGFIPYGDHAGGSPDGICSRFGVIEIKCPYNFENHVQNLLIADEDDLFKQRKPYWWQLQMNMIVSGKEEGMFISYDPRMDGKNKLAIIPVHLQSDSKEILDNAIAMAVKYKQFLIEKLGKR